MKRTQSCSNKIYQHNYSRNIISKLIKCNQLIKKKKCIEKHITWKMTIKYTEGKTTQEKAVYYENPIFPIYTNSVTEN